MSNSGNSVKNEEIREVAIGDITASYVALGPPLEHDAFRITFTNDTDANIYFTVDPLVNTRKAAASTARVLDDKTNDMYTKAGTQFYIKYETVPGIGTGAWLEIEYV
jgi:hypothetical protein